MDVADAATARIMTRAEAALGARDWDGFRDSVTKLLPRVNGRLELLGAFALQLVDEGDLVTALDIWGHFIDAVRAERRARPSVPRAP